MSGIIPVGAVMDITARITLIVLTFLLALAVGLFLRLKAVNRLKKTVLDNWIIQTLGVLIVLAPLMIALIATPFIYIQSMSGISTWWREFSPNVGLNKLNASELIWNLTQTILLIALGIGIARTLHSLIIRNLGQNRIDINIRTLIARILSVLIFIVIAFWILAIWNISIAIPVAALGVVTVALTVSVQDVLKDLAAGFYILIDRPFFIGDQITIDTNTGKVQDVQLRATKLRLLTGEEIIIPNSKVFSAVIKNSSFYDEGRATLLIILPEEHFQRDETTAQIIGVLKDIEHIVPKPEPTVTFTKYVEKKATLTLQFYIARGHQSEALSDTMYALHAVLPQAALGTPENMTTVSTV